MNLTFIIWSLGPGGAERFLCTIANYFASKGSRVTVLTYVDCGATALYDFDAGVEIVTMALDWPHRNRLHSHLSRLKRLSVIRRAILKSRPDCVISLMTSTNVRTLFAVVGTGIPVIVSERVDPASMPLEKKWRLLRRISYPLADAVVVQTERVKHYFDRWSLKRLCVIPNPVPAGLPAGGNRGGATDAPKKVISMGRLTSQKRHDLLLRAFARVVADVECTLTIVGEGPLRVELELLRDELGLGELVQFPGLEKRPWDVFAQSDLFVLSSEFEGMPNALMEAMACGLPVISFDCPTGPREIIRHGIDGVLIPPLNVGSLSREMTRVLTDDFARCRMAERAVEIRERFSMDRIMRMWESVIAAVRSRGARRERIPKS